MVGAGSTSVIGCVRPVNCAYILPVSLLLMLISIFSLGGIVINLRNDLDNTLNNSTSNHSSENQKLTFNYEFVNDKSYSNTYDIYLNLDLLFNKHHGLL